MFKIATNFIVHKHYLFIILSFLFFNCYAQQLSQVTFSQASDFSWFSISTNQSILIRISSDGKILEYGTEEASLYNRNYFAPKLLPYSGVVNYYQHEPDSLFDGKIKNIGTCFFTYYGSKDYAEKIGKIKSAGSLLFDYYRQYEDDFNAGKIKSIGTNTIAYYNLLDNEALKGKLKSVGNTSISYYSSFDNTSLKGKLKSIGPFHFDWATTSTGREFVSYLKTGNQRQLINGILYIPQ